MMWEREYIEFQGQTAQGNKTRAEAEIMWKNLGESGVKSDDKGPHGMKRLRVKLGDFDSDFDEVFTEDEVEAVVATKKNATAADVSAMADRARMGSSSSVFAPDDPDEAQGSGRQAMRDDFMNALIAEGAGNVGSSSGSMAPISLRSLAASCSVEVDGIMD